ncbi:hypothetical protein [Desulfovibrio sp. An276]|uniref:hypothetical protein n=1 Tax=Desulfovibrio sp. An276 TaxID=1965618 RepID=UPI0013A6827C|nr:hypothetical protein [Desulfovibrio sp. An276]
MRSSVIGILHLAENGEKQEKTGGNGNQARHRQSSLQGREKDTKSEEHKERRTQFGSIHSLPALFLCVKQLSQRTKVRKSLLTFGKAGKVPAETGNRSVQEKALLLPFAGTVREKQYCELILIAVVLPFVLPKTGRKHPANSLHYRKSRLKVNRLARKDAEKKMH